MKKITVSLICGISLGLFISGCEKVENVSQDDSETIYTYVNEVSADAQFNSNIGLASEQPVFDENSQKIGKRLYVDSYKELINEESIKEFYEYIIDVGVDYEEIVISMGNNEAIQVFLKSDEVWYCSINDNMEITKIKKIYK